MIQFNLLPDVKVDYLKASRTKRLVMIASIAVTSLALFIFVLLFLIVNVFQKQHLGNLNKDIAESTAQLKSINDLDKVLTVQNQLNKLTPLHDQKPEASRMTDYLVKLTPNDAKISQVSVDFAANTIEINGSALNLETINKYVDTLKFTDYKTGDAQAKAFSEIVLTSFGVSKENKTAYGIQFKFDPMIFDTTKQVELIVPSIISTRSVTERPSDLFEPKTTNGTGN